jgi:hypothetical protein
MKTRRKRIGEADYKGSVRHRKGAGAPATASIADAPKSRELLAKALQHPEGSPDRLQVFSEYLNALRDEHAK